MDRNVYDIKPQKFGIIGEQSRGKAAMIRASGVEGSHFVQSTAPVLTASDIIHRIGRAHPADAMSRGRCVLAWIGAGRLGGLLCWLIVANHFALLQPADEYVSTAVNHWASRNEVINHAIYIAGQADFPTGALMVALVIAAGSATRQRRRGRGCCSGSARSWCRAW